MSGYETSQQHVFATGMGVTKPILFVPLFFSSSIIAKTNVTQWISRLYLAGVTAAQHVKHEYDWMNLTGTFTRSKILLMDKLTNGALVTPNLIIFIFNRPTIPESKMLISATAIDYT